MSLLEKLIRQLGSVDIDPEGLVLVVDGREVQVTESVSIRVAATAPRVVPAPPLPDVIVTDGDEEEDEEWEWQLAMARARAAQPAVAKEVEEEAEEEEDEEWEWQLAMARARAAAAGSDEDDEREWARRLAMARAMSMPVPAEPESVPRPRRVPKGTEPPVSIDEDITTEIEIRRPRKARPLPGMPAALRERTPPRRYPRPAIRRAPRAHKTVVATTKTKPKPQPKPQPRPVLVPPPLPPPPGEGDR